MAKCPYVMGLAKMSEEYLNVTIDKNQQCSDWDNEDLSEAQILYGTLDVLVAIELFRLFAGKIAHNEHYCMQKVFDICSEYADMNFK